MASTPQDLGEKKTTITYQETNNDSPCGLGHSPQRSQTPKVWTPWWSGPD